MQKAVLPKLSHMFGEPFSDSSQIPTYLVSKLDAGACDGFLERRWRDELFCGYGTHQSITNVGIKSGKSRSPCAVRQDIF